MSKSVYVLGAGGIGCLVAAPLVDSFSVNFIVRNAGKRAYLAKNSNLFQFKQLFNNDKVLQYHIHGAYSVEEIPDQTIDRIIVSVKTFDTVKALRPLLDKIGQSTKILLVQNGMGVIDELYNELWPVVDKRPIFYQGVISHGVYQDLSEKDTYNYNHAGSAGMMICRLPRDFTNPGSIEFDGELEKADDFVKELVGSDYLNAQFFKYKDLLVYQVQKLMVNSCMNANTSILDCINYELDTPMTRDLYREIISEAIAIYEKAFPVLKESELHDGILGVDELLRNTVKCGFVQCGKNSTSMRQDVLNLRDVEIDYINGYTVRLGEKVGLPATVNHAIELLVKIRLQIYRSRAGRKT
ncbi:DEKNAAC100830 [Brettanomyces naardenensis]|uniref:2-dehydropantoate 2-reductase n=1 Tax=Brettanomyces naardenensis TaxID=13370 RepID=A0A448YGU2_BRENA|nr:DEKNAAC100830 [Brettanomyces naardenensis]